MSRRFRLVPICRCFHSGPHWHALALFWHHTYPKAKVKERKNSKTVAFLSTQSKNSPHKKKKKVWETRKDIWGCGPSLKSCRYCFQRLWQSPLSQDSESCQIQGTVAKSAPVRPMVFQTEDSSPYGKESNSHLYWNAFWGWRARAMLGTAHERYLAPSLSSRTCFCTSDLPHKLWRGAQPRHFLIISFPGINTSDILILH